MGRGTGQEETSAATHHLARRRGVSHQQKLSSALDFSDLHGPSTPLAKFISQYVATQSIIPDTTPPANRRKTRKRVKAVINNEARTYLHNEDSKAVSSRLEALTPYLAVATKALDAKGATDTSRKQLDDALHAIFVADEIGDATYKTMTSWAGKPPQQFPTREQAAEFIKEFMQEQPAVQTPRKERKLPNYVIEYMRASLNDAATYVSGLRNMEHVDSYGTPRDLLHIADHLEDAVKYSITDEEIFREAGRRLDPNRQDPAISITTSYAQYLSRSGFPPANYSFDYWLKELAERNNKLSAHESSWLIKAKVEAPEKLFPWS